MATNNDDAGCPQDRTIRVYNYSLLALMRKAPNETPAQFNQRRMLALDFVLIVARMLSFLNYKYNYL
jgi:hypothetical protein